MAISIPRALVEFILLGPEDDRRQLQDSPILGDVWVQFAKYPNKQLELLITPYKDEAAGAIAATLAGYAKLGKDRSLLKADVAFLQGIIAARLSFEQVLRFIIPMTSWWSGRNEEEIGKYLKQPAKLQTDLQHLLDAAAARHRQDDPARQTRRPMQDIEAHKRYIALAGLILWAKDQPERKGWDKLPIDEQIARIVGVPNLKRVIGGLLVNAFRRLCRPPVKGGTGERPKLVWTISRNRMATPAVSMSVPAVKADAARTLFSVNCSGIVWAVIDSGIDAGHRAFRSDDGRSRIVRSFDFTRIRQIVSLDNLYDDETRLERVSELLRRGLKARLTKGEASTRLKEVARRAKEGRTINWELVEALIEIDPETRTTSNHGTHVAGILGARGARDSGVAVNTTDRGEADGMCPDIKLYDFRVLAPDLKETEFAIIAALQYIRYVNERNSFMSIHGANLSLSIPHDVRNYACGRTPVCNECERLVNSGVVVVAAAGNRGYHGFETQDGLYESYAAFSVTDPGNADGVITVGATHRNWPHTYGVSFFSSRGPTGDGRLKPDLVAPGERIYAPVPENEWADLDGTSMAAPHVSGAAAMLMARYSEVIGDPRRIKQILCDSATDLGRERTFQGRGMLDVLRAFQSV